MTAARELATWAVELHPGDIPDDVRGAAALHMLDALGCGLAAAASGAGTQARDALGAGVGPASVIGRRESATARDAAFANGVLCHALDYDDTHAEAVAHVSAVVVPAALAVAEETGAGGAELLDAVIAANEVVARIGAATQGGIHRRGFHPTSVCGVFGAATAAARLRGLDAEAATRAFGIAGSFSGGIMEYLADGSATKPLHAGWAAQGGLLAAALAAHGAGGPASVLEGRFGVLATHADGPWDIGPQLATLGRRWETPAITFKPYPACHYTHAAIEAVRAALGATARPDEVTGVLVQVPEGAVDLVCEPAAAKAAPQTGYDAKFSLPYVVAAAIVDGTVDVATFAETRIAEPDLLAVAARVRYEVADLPTSGRAFPAAVRIELAGGRTLRAQVDHEPGHPRNPLGEGAVIKKFRAAAGAALDEPAVAALEAFCLHPELAPDVREPLARLRAAATTAEVTV